MQTNTSGNVVNDQKYYAYGKQRDTNAPVGTDHQYTGQKLDGTGLMYYNARYYDPQIGQFISPDTIVPDPTNALDYNRYMYVRGRVLNYNDPTGHQMSNPVFSQYGGGGGGALLVGLMVKTVNTVNRVSPATATKIVGAINKASPYEQVLTTFRKTGLTPKFQRAIGTKLGEGNYFSIRGTRLKSSMLLENYYDPKTPEMSQTEGVVQGIEKFGVRIDAGIRTAPDGTRQLSDVDLGWVFNSSSGGFLTNTETLKLKDAVNILYPTRTGLGIMTHGDQFNGVIMNSGGLNNSHLTEPTQVFKVINGLPVLQYTAPWKETVINMTRQAQMAGPLY